MKKYFKSVLSKIYQHFFTSGRAEKIITNISIRSQINLLQLAHKNIGVMKYQNPTVSGEAFFLSEVLPKLIKNLNTAIFFDVGANIGHYSNLLAHQFSNATIFAFEPNPQTFQQLQNNANTTQNIRLTCNAFGSEEKVAEIFTYADNDVSEHASLLENVLTDLHKAKQTKKFTINISTIDIFCADNKIDKIDFLKIDTEGYEMEVLKGASQMITEGLIDIIQFEFNEMNVISKVFLKDFYNILPGYNFFRLDSNKLIALNNYNPANEIFLFQNIIAIKQNLN